MPVTNVSHEYVENWNQSVAVVRQVGEVRGVSVEIWRSFASERIALVVLPTVRGFTVLAVGGLDEVETFAKVGGCILEAMAGVLPLVVGDIFREPRAAPAAPLRQ